MSRNLGLGKHPHAYRVVKADGPAITLREALADRGAARGSVHAAERLHAPPAAAFRKEHIVIRRSSHQRLQQSRSDERHVPRHHQHWTITARHGGVDTAQAPLIR